MNHVVRTTLIMAACGMLAVTMSACGKRGAPFQMPPASVTMGKAVKMDTPILISAFGNTEEKMSIDIMPQVSGILLKSLVKDGETVKAGQPMFEIDPSDYAARVRQGEGMVKADKANLELARSTRERNTPLFEKKLISTETFDTIRTKVASIEAQLQMDEAALEQANLSLTRCTIKAPIDGVCSKRYVDEGNLVAAGMSRLTNIRSYDPLRVAFSVPDQYLTAIRTAMAAGKVKIEILTNGQTNMVDGTLEFVDNAVNPMTGTILLRGEVPNADKKLWANQFVEVHIFAGMVTGAVMVPESAVMFGKRGPYLYAVTKESKAEMRPVKLGIRYQDLIQVLDGVAADEPIVVLGQFMLFPGAAMMDLAKMQQESASAKPAAGQGADVKKEAGNREQGSGAEKKPDAAPAPEKK